MGGESRDGRRSGGGPAAPFLVAFVLLVVGPFGCLGAPLLFGDAADQGEVLGQGFFVLSPDADGHWTVPRRSRYLLTIEPLPGSEREPPPDSVPGSEFWPDGAFGFRAVGSTERIPLEPEPGERMLPFRVGTADLVPGRYDVWTPDLEGRFEVAISDCVPAGLGVGTAGGGGIADRIANGGLAAYAFGVACLLGAVVALIVGVVRLARRG